MVSEAAEREWRAAAAPDHICVELKAAWHRGLCLPCAGGQFLVWAKFARMNCTDYWLLENEISVRVELGGGRDVTSYMDMYELRRQFVRRFLREWNLGVALDFDPVTGWLSNECFERVGGLPGPLLMALAAKYETDIFPNEKEQQDIDKQCALLFSERSVGVAEPCETVALYCVASNFWDKFGLNRNDLRSMPYREFIRLRLMVHRENSAFSARMKDKERSSKSKGRTNMR
jgi:hypothetical protein